VTSYLELVPEDFKVPLCLDSEIFRLRMLTVRDLVIDYDAVMTSVEHLRATYSTISGSDWPFRAPAFPLREIPLDVWQQLPQGSPS
jgi:hypothetical protein